ncbi:MAG: potassium transporter TrkA, partial [Candidatus Limnocylindria bacterium]
LGVTRPDGVYLGVPTRETVVQSGDTLVMYARAGLLEELDHRRRGAEGEEAHERAKADAAREREEARGSERPA